MVRIRPEKEEILPRASRTFTDRETPKKAFKDALEGKSPDDHKILMFYGNGGFGKSRLIEHLFQQCGDSPWAVLDFRNTTFRNKTDALLALRNRLRKFGKRTSVTKQLYSFMAFDLAYALWKRKARPSDPISEEQLWGLEQSGIVGDILAALKDIPVAGIVPKVLALAVKGHTRIKNYVVENRIQIHRWEEMEPYRIEQELPKLWAEDARKYFQSIAPGRTPVLFLDTYEALWENHAKGTFHSVDGWVRDLVTELHEPLWVICGRENLRWAEKRHEWKEAIESHRLGGLSKADCESFLRSCGIDDSGVIAAITGSGGKAPLYLDVAVDTWYQIKNKLDRIPVPEDFHQATRGTSFRQNLDVVLGRFLMYLTPVQQRIVKLLAVPRFWDDALLAKLLKKFASRYTVEDFEEELGQYVLFERDEKMSPPRWTMHESVRESFLPELSKKRKDEVEKFLFRYYDTQLEGIATKDLRERQVVAFQEAFHHGKEVMEIGKFCEWFDERNDFFYSSGVSDELLFYMNDELLRIQEETLGPESIEVAHTLDRLGHLCQNIALMQEAERFYLRSLSIFKNRKKPTYNVAWMLNTMGVFYRDMGKYEKAKEYHLQAKTYVEKECASDSELLVLVRTEVCLGKIFGFQNNGEDSEAAYRRALTICERSFGVDSSEYADVLEELAVCVGLRDTGRDCESEGMMRKALLIRETKYGQKSEEAARSAKALGALLESQGDNKGAEVQYRRALEIREKLWGGEHPSVSDALNFLGTFLINQRQYDEADKMYKRARSGLEKIYGSEHPDVADVLVDLGLLYDVTKRYDNSVAMYQKARTIYEKVYDLNHPKVIKSLNGIRCAADALEKLGEEKENQNQLEEAVSCYRQALVIREGAYDPYHEAIASSLNTLGCFLAENGRAEEAIPFLLRAVDIERRAKVREIPSLANYVDSLATAYRETGHFSEAEILYREALGIWDAKLGPENIDKTEALMNLGLLFARTDRCDQAISLFRQGIEIIEKDPETAPVSIEKILEEFAGVLKIIGNIDEWKSVMERIANLGAKTTSK